MLTDPTIREQGYIYFLAEAPELLQTIEQELFSLADGHNTAKVHTLMRATHTIKGGAANVGLETIQTVAHYLEDIFKALYNPEVVIDSELQTLLLQAYECLHLPLSAELTGNAINDEEILQRSATIFAHLQAKLGDFFNKNNSIPTSVELGFDITQSVFEMGVGQRLESIAEAIKNQLNEGELVELLQTQAEVFLGLAESLDLPGFGAIAATTLAALLNNPDQVQTIAELALADLQEGREAVLAGDRTRGGQPSPALQNLTTVATAPTTNSIADVADSLRKNHLDSSFPATFLQTEFSGLYQFLTESNSLQKKPWQPAITKVYLRIIRYILGWFNHEVGIPYPDLCLSLLIPKLDGDNPQELETTLKYFHNWLSIFIDFVHDKTDSYSLKIYRQGVILKAVTAVAQFQHSNGNSCNTGNCHIPIIQVLQSQIRELAQEYKNLPPITSDEKNWLNHPKLQKLLEIRAEPPIVNTKSSDRKIEEIWGAEIEEPTESLIWINQSPILENADKNDEQLLTTPLPTAEGNNTATTVEVIPHSVPNIPQLEKSRRAFVRVDVTGLEHLNYLAGEMLIQQNRQTVQEAQLQEIVQKLSDQLYRHQLTLNELYDLPEFSQIRYNALTKNFLDNSLNPTTDAGYFDSLELDEYTQANLGLHSALEETLQLQETIESLQLILRQAEQTLEKQQRLSANVRDELLATRMMPLYQVIYNLPEMVEKLCKVYGKQVELKLNGTEILIDKAVAENLYDPLLQLVRNAFDHGIESPDVRRQSGKPETGLIEICAYNHSSQTIIDVRDDGKGLNIEKIRQQALQLNLIPQSATSGNFPLLEVLFSPGFSTAAQVNEISGRGMGLDIVKSRLESIHGSINVESIPQQGTTFRLKIPFSMTTAQLMLVQAGERIYGLLLDTVERILLPSAEQIKSFDGKKVLYLNHDNQQQMVNLRQLSDLMQYNCHSVNGTLTYNDLTANHQNKIPNPLVLLRKNTEIVGLEVDHILGEQELTVRQLSNTIFPPKYVYGSSILPNGSLVLVIDGAGLVEDNSRQELTAEILPQAVPMLDAGMKMQQLLTASKVKDDWDYQGIANVQKLLLVVDDALSFRQTVTLTLQKSGYQVLQAHDGLDALEKLEHFPGVGLIISDLEMPRMNGFELLSQIRQSTHMADLPVMILTSRSAEKHRQLAIELGATAYLTKPYLEPELLVIVGELVK